MSRKRVENKKRKDWEVQKKEREVGMGLGGRRKRRIEKRNKKHSQNSKLEENGGGNDIQINNQNQKSYWVKLREMLNTWH